MDENNKLRLMAMADHIEYNVEDAQFYMPWWKRVMDEMEGPECGTAGCAVGHTMHLIPELRFHLSATLPGHDCIQNKATGSLDFEALEEVLGLTCIEVGWLFGPDSYKYGYSWGGETGIRLEVAKRIRGFAKGELEGPK